MRNVISNVRFVAGLTAFVTIVFAQSAMSAEGDPAQKGDGIIEPGEDEIAELARAAQNPVANMISLPIQNNMTFDTGPQGKVLNVMNIQPVWPISVTDDWNVITRTVFPVVSAPPLAPEGTPGPLGERQWDLADTLYTAFLSPSKPDKWIGGKVLWGLGPVVQIPTSTSDLFGKKWGLGPSAVFLAMPGNFVLGGLINNIWSVGGSGDQDVNQFFSQFFVNYNLSGGWYLITAPIITANWKADEGNKWTVPVGGGFGKIFRWGKAPPMNVNIQGYYNAVKPDGIGRGVLRLQFQLMFPKRR